MNILRTIFGQDDTFFSLLEASAVEAKNSVGLLVSLIRNPGTVPTLDEFVQSRRKDKRLTEDITEALCTTFVTPLEREDIERLSFTLYKIPKTVEKFSEKFLLCRDHLKDVDFLKQATLLEEATDTVVQMVQTLHSRANLNSVKDQNHRLHAVEGEADRLMLTLVKDLYSGRHEALKVIVLLDLYETLEEIIDRCRDAGNTVFQVVLKYS